MLTTYNATMTRSTRVLWLLEELGADYTMVPVTIARPDGTGAPDPRNPHPLKQVPAIEHDGTLLVESVVVWIHLADSYPQAGLAPPLGDPQRAAYMSWLGLANAVLEPLLATSVLAGAAFTDRQLAAREDLAARMRDALARGPWLLGERFTTADLAFSILAFYNDALPDPASRADWIARLRARPAARRAMLRDAERPAPAS